MQNEVIKGQCHNKAQYGGPTILKDFNVLGYHPLKFTVYSDCVQVEIAGFVQPTSFTKRPRTRIEKAKNTYFISQYVTPLTDGEEKEKIKKILGVQ